MAPLLALRIIIAERYGILASGQKDHITLACARRWLPW
jgi:hypothetical protein